MAGPLSARFSSPPAAAGYSHAVTLPPGQLVWTSGQVGIDVDGVMPPDLEGQTRLAFENLTSALGSAGAGWADVVKLTWFVTAVDDLPTIRAVRDEYVNTSAPPTSSLIQVAGLFLPGLLVEVEAVAWLPA